MKKFFAMLVIISVLVGMFSVAAFADDVAEFDTWYQFWTSGEKEGEVDGFTGDWHVFKAGNGKWYCHFLSDYTLGQLLGFGEKAWCPICNDNPTEEPPAGGEIESGTTPDEPTSSEPVESETDTTPVESETDTTPVESETDTTPVESETDTTPVESETDTTPVESETDTTPVESETDTTPVESETDTTPVESETDTTPVESETDTTPTEDDKDADKDNDNDVPNTGDNSMTALWMTVLGVSAMAFVATLIVGKKKSF